MLIKPPFFEIQRRTPLAARLTAVLFPGQSLIEPVTSTRLSLGSAGRIIDSRAGTAIQSTQINQGLSAVAPASLRVNGPISLFWHGEILSQSHGIGTLIGISYTNTDSAPYAAYVLGMQDNFPSLRFYYNNAGTFGFYDMGSVYPSSGVHTILLTATASRVRAYIDGLTYTPAAGGTYAGTQTYAANAMLNFNGDFANRATRWNNTNGSIGYIWSRELTQTEAALLTHDPFILTRPSASRPWRINSGNAGSVAITLRPATLTAAGTLTLKGSTAVTLRVATLTATGHLQPLAHGSAAVTLRAATLTASGTLALKGQTAVTLRPASLAATGYLQPRAVASAAVTLQPASLVATGSLQPVAFGQSSVTLWPATLSASGALALRGAVSAQMRPATVVATAGVMLGGQAAITLRPATLAALGVLPLTGQAGITLQAAVLEATGLLLRGLIGEREYLTGVSPSPITLSGVQRMPPTLPGHSDMTQV